MENMSMKTLTWAEIALYVTLSYFLMKSCVQPVSSRAVFVKGKSFSNTAVEKVRE